MHLNQYTAFKSVNRINATINLFIPQVTIQVFNMKRKSNIDLLGNVCKVHCEILYFIHSLFPGRNHSQGLSALDGNHFKVLDMVKAEGFPLVFNCKDI